MAQFNPNISLNMVKVLERELETLVKNTITEKVIKTELARAEEELREKIKPIVEQVTIGKVDHFKDLLRIREEIHVYLHWHDEQTPPTRQ